MNTGLFGWPYIGGELQFVPFAHILKAEVLRQGDRYHLRFQVTEELGSAVYVMRKGDAPFQDSHSAEAELRMLITAS